MGYKESVWRDVKLERKIEYEDVVYYEPLGWEKIPASGKHEGYYYYPYHDRTAMMWVTRKEAPEVTHAKEFPYYSVMKGWSKDPENIISICDYTENGMTGKRILHWTPVEDQRFETLTYMMPVGDYVYICTFGEKDGLSRGIRNFAESFMEKYALHEESENHDEGGDTFAALCDIAIRMGNLTCQRLGRFVADIDMA